jgi:hypothetical protein
MSFLKICQIGAIMLAVAITGCATIVTKHPESPDKTPNGVRVYPPKVYLFVDKAANESQLLVLPDYKHAYDIKPLTILAKQDFKIDVDDGIVKALTSNQDTTAFLTVLTKAAELGAKAAGIPVSKQTLKGTFGLDEGVYELNDEGRFVRLPSQP